MEPTPSLPRLRPRLAVIGTGGTIAGSIAAAAGFGYRAGVAGIEELLGELPQAQALADLEPHQLYNVDSVEMTAARQLEIARETTAQLARGDIDGAIVTHGTDSLEETAFLLHQLVRTDKPVVVVGAMRPADAVSADGPGNLLDAVRVAADSSTYARGVVTVNAGLVYSARDVVKVDTASLAAFGSPSGPLARVGAQGVRWQRWVSGRHTAQSPFDLDAVTGGGEGYPAGELPKVVAVLSHADTPVEILDAVVASGAQGVVTVGLGNGNLPQRVADWVRLACARGIAVVRSTRVTGGRVTRNGSLSDDELGTVAAGDLDSPKARLLLALALTQTEDPGEIQELFDRC